MQLTGCCRVGEVSWLDPSAKGRHKETNAWHTLVTVEAPLRSPLRARVERKEDLAHMIGKLASIPRESRNRIGRGWGLDIEVGGRKGSKARPFASLASEENPAFRNGPTLIGRSHVIIQSLIRRPQAAAIQAQTRRHRHPRLPDADLFPAPAPHPANPFRLMLHWNQCCLSCPAPTITSSHRVLLVLLLPANSTFFRS